MTKSHIQADENISKPALSFDKGAVVAIDHDGAKIFSLHDEDKGADREQVHPHGSHGSHHHLPRRGATDATSGKHDPEDIRFYDRIATLLADAPRIVLVGHGHGEANAAAVLLAHLKHHDAPTAARVIATETADLSAITDHQIVALGRKAMHHHATTGL